MDTRFDHLIFEALKQKSLMVKFGNSITRSLRHFRRAAYRATEAIMQLQEGHHNDLLRFVQTEGKSIDEWIDEVYVILETNFNEDRRNIFQAIRDGVTERQYVARGAIWATTKAKPKQTGTSTLLDAVPSMADVPSLNISDQEKISLLQAKVEELASQLRKTRDELKAALADCVLKQRIIIQLERLTRRKTA